jgi:hypothetical protein
MQTQVPSLIGGWPKQHILDMYSLLASPTFNISGSLIPAILAHMLCESTSIGENSKLYYEHNYTGIEFRHQVGATASEIIHKKSGTPFAQFDSDIAYLNVYLRTIMGKRYNITGFDHPLTFIQKLLDGGWIGESNKKQYLENFKAHFLSIAKLLKQHLNI